MTSTAEELTISIVTACYNSSRFLGRIHRSLANQSYKNFEWICVDDSSLDDTVEQLARLPAPGSLGMQVYRLPVNTGGPVALALGTQRARGEVVIWLGHDDELLQSALAQVRDNWKRVRHDPSLSGIFFRSMDNNRMLVGGALPVGARVTASELMNRYPEAIDGLFATKNEILRTYATIQFMENVSLNGVLHLPLTKDFPFLIGGGPPVRIYHRDNEQSQTRFPRVSRKTVASYARILNCIDVYFLLRPGRTIRRIVTMLRYSKEVHGRWFEGLRFINRLPIRVLCVLLWPLGVFAYYAKPASNLVEYELFRSDSGLQVRNLWRGR